MALADSYPTPAHDSVLRPRTQWLLLTLLVAGAVMLLAVEDFATTVRLAEVLPDISDGSPGWHAVALPWASWLLLAPVIAYLGWRFVPGRVRWWWAVLAHAIAASIAPWVLFELHRLLAMLLFDCDVVSGGAAAEFSESVEIFTFPEDGATAVEVTGLDADAIGGGAGSGIGVVGLVDSAHWWLALHEVSRWLGLSAVAVVPSLALLSGERERLRDQAARELAETETRMLRGQLQPHFLFNALNGIQVLIDEDPARAQLYLRRLSGLLRNTLEDAHLPVLKLSRELEILDDYLAIERLRFGERVEFVLEVEPGLGDVLVPSFMIQPLIENSLVHGPGSVPGVGCIRVRIAKRDTGLEVSVVDDGPGAPRSGMKFGRGLGVLQRRLSRHFGQRAELRLESPQQGGFTVTVRLPADEESAS